MYNIDEMVLNKILKRKFISLVGVSCQRFEKFLTDNNINVSTKILEDYKNLFKKEVYDSERSIKEQISAFDKGTKISIKFKRPTS